MNPSAAEFVPTTLPLAAVTPPNITVAPESGPPKLRYHTALPHQYVPRWLEGVSSSPWRELRNTASNAFPAMIYVGGEPIGRCWAVNTHLHVDGVAAAIYRHYCATNDWADFIVVFTFTRDYEWRLRFYPALAHRDDDAELSRLRRLHNYKLHHGGVALVKHSGDIREVLTKPSEPPAAPRVYKHVDEIVGSIMQMIDDD